MAGKASTGAWFLNEAVEIEIVSGVLTVTQSLVTVEGEGGANDDLVTIEYSEEFLKSGYQTPLYLKAKSGRTITIKNSGGNIRLKAGSDFSLTGELTKPLLRMSGADNFNDW